MSNGQVANLKGRILALEEVIRTLAEELNMHKKEVSVLRSEKVTLETVLNQKTSECKSDLMEYN